MTLSKAILTVIGDQSPTMSPLPVEPQDGFMDQSTTFQRTNKGKSHDFGARGRTKFVWPSTDGMTAFASTRRIMAS